MIQTPPFIDLHTHTRYPDNNSFPINEIEDAAINGGYSDVLAMANSEIPIDSIANLNIAREFDEKLTAPSWGYKSVDDYYYQASPLTQIKNNTFPLSVKQYAIYSPNIQKIMQLIC